MGCLNKNEIAKSSHRLKKSEKLHLTENYPDREDNSIKLEQKREVSIVTDMPLGYLARNISDTILVSLFLRNT